MKKSIPAFFGIFILVIGFVTVTKAQSHDLHLILNKNGATTCSETIGESYMNEGQINEDNILMQRIDIDAAGYLYFQTDANYAGSDDILFSLSNENDANQFYRIQLTGGSAILEATNETLPVRGFTPGDSFRMVRCGCLILYYHNETMIQVVEITDDDFPLVGEITVNNAVDVSLHVQFDQTHTDGNCMMN